MADGAETTDSRLPAPRDVAAEIRTAIPCYMARCNGHLVKRNGKRTVFYGCTNWPTCDAIMDGHDGDELIAVRVYGVTFDADEPRFGP